MKRLLSYIVVLAALVSCGKDYVADAGGQSQGCASISIGVADTRAVSSYPWTYCDIRVYKYNDEGYKELIRHYFEVGDMPAEMWLLEGRYNIDVRLGDRTQSATFDKPYYDGNTDFEITGGQRTPVEVNCKIRNTIVEVVFDESVRRIFDLGYRTMVMTGDSFNTVLFEEGVNGLTYGKPADGTAGAAEHIKGYFTIPSDCDKLSFCFNGKSSNPDIVDHYDDSDGWETVPGEIHNHYDGYALDAGKIEGYCYRITFKYSEDLNGYVGCNMDIVIAEEDEPAMDEAGINPSPKPTIEGVGFDVGGRIAVADKVQYLIKSAEKALARIEVACDGGEAETLTCSASDGPTVSGGITLEYDAETPLLNITLTIGREYLDRLSGGDHYLTIKAFTVSNENECESDIRTQGTVSLTPTDCWNSKAEVKAYVFAEEPSQVQIRSRAKGAGEEAWQAFEAVEDADGLYKAEAEGIGANAEYEYQLLVDGVAVGAPRIGKTPDGPQIYNSGFEVWSGTSPLLPYLGADDQWWDTGNHGSSTLSKNVTEKSTDAHSGTFSARLNSQYVSLLGIGKFGAGNIFIGKYVGTYQTTHGCIAFGKPFTYTYRPRELKFWVKGNAGVVNRVGSGSNSPVKSGDSDVNEVYICLCDMEGPHIVKTTDTDTFLNIPGIKEMPYCSDENITTGSTNNASGKVIAYGVWDNDRSVNDGKIENWTEITVKLEYNTGEDYDDVVPNYLMLTASSSKFGDYFSGSEASELYIDDVQLVY